MGKISIKDYYCLSETYWWQGFLLVCLFFFLNTKARSVWNSTHDEESIIRLVAQGALKVLSQMKIMYLNCICIMDIVEIRSLFLMSVTPSAMCVRTNFLPVAKRQIETKSGWSWVCEQGSNEDVLVLSAVGGHRPYSKWSHLGFTKSLIFEILKELIPCDCTLKSSLNCRR